MDRAQQVDDLHVQVDVQAVLAQLRIQPDSPAAPRVEALAAQIQASVHPKALFRQCIVESCGAGTARIAGVEFSSRTLAALLDSIDEVFAYVVTCGPDGDVQLPEDSGAFDRVVLDALLNHVLRQGCRAFEQRLSQQFGLGETSTLGPGAGDGVLWPIEQQRALFSLLGDTHATIGVTLTEDYLMLPMKSLSGLLFPTATGFNSCQLCTSPDCGMRDVPFDSRVRDALANGRTLPTSS